MESMEKRFEDFFDNCKKQRFTATQMRSICQPLIWNQRVQNAKILAKIGIVLLLIYLLYNWIDSFAWFASAIGRLLLIQVLPIWNWTPIYNAKCLIERPVDQDVATISRLGKYETDTGNCLLCESIERIPIATNVTFSQLETVYLERGLPIIITDSHQPKTTMDFFNAMLQATTAGNFLDSKPCDVSTNLVLKKFFNLNLILEKIKSAHIMDKWFLQLRNCQFSAVKASRIFVTRPYYYPLHLEPFYTSWVLMSHNYADHRKKEIYLQGLVFVQQLNGHFDIELRPKQPCNDICPVINIRLAAGECLAFSTDLWIFSYGTESSTSSALTDQKETMTTSIATILEIDWHL